jgi:hypothetical protein
MNLGGIMVFYQALAFVLIASYTAISAGVPAARAKTLSQFNFEDHGAPKAWVNGEGEVRDYSVYSPFEYGLAIAAEQIFARGDKWVLVKKAFYRYYYAAPIGTEAITVSQKPLTKRELANNVVYFFYSKLFPELHFSLTTYEGWIEGVIHGNLQYRGNKEDEALALGFVKELEHELITNSGYRGGVLEFRGSGLVGFLKDIESYNLSWEHLILEGELKQQLIQGIDGFIKYYDYEKWKKYGLPLSQGALVYGPPGTGKTLIGKIIISNVLQNKYPNPVTYMHVQSRHITDLERVRTIFQVARQLNPTVLFFEDIDLIAGTDRNDRAQIKNELMQQLSGIETLEGVLTIGTTNVADQIDPALKRSKRLGLHYYLGLPNQIERSKLFKVFLKAFEFGQGQLDGFASRTEGLSGADIKQICQTATEFAITTKIQSKSSSLKVLDSDVLKAIEFRKKTRLPK